MRSAVRGLVGAACLLAGGLLLTPFALAVASASSTSAPRTTAVVASAGGAAGSRVEESQSESQVQSQSQSLALGLSAGERAALQRSGAYGAHPVRMLILGDSIALTLGMGLADGSQAAYGITIDDHATLGCDLDPQLPVRTTGVAGPATAGCQEWRSLWPFLTAAEHPQVVALGIGRWEVSDHRLDGRWVHVGQPVWDAHLEGDLRAAVAIFHQFGARVVLFTMPYVDPTARQADGHPWAENTAARTRAFNAIVWRVARADPTQVSVIDLNRMLSPAGVYTASVDGVRVRWPDGVHVTTAAGQLLQRQILPQIDRIGLVDKEEAAARAHV